MRSEISVTFANSPPLRIDLGNLEPLASDAARRWLDDAFTQMDCEPLRPTGKLLIADKVVVVAEAAGLTKFEDAGWALAFARAASAALGKPVVHIDVPLLSISY